MSDALRLAGGLEAASVEDALKFLEQVVVQTPASIWTVNPDLVFTWAAGLGLVVPASEIVGKTIVEFLGPEFEGSPAVLSHRGALEGKRSTYALRWGGHVFDIRVSPWRDAKGDIVGAIGFAVDATEREQNRTMLEASQAELQLLAQRLQSVREEEQKRISREIHDQLGSMLSLFRVELTRLRGKLTWRQRGLQESVDGLLDDAAGLLATVRRIAAELRPPVLQNVQYVGLGAVLRFVAEDIHRRTGFPVHLDLDIDESRVDPKRAETAYHVVREALNNVMIHAGAVRAVVTGLVEGDDLVLEVLDDGRGIAAPGPASMGGLGMLGIRERLRVWGGRVDVPTDAAGGARISIRLPLGPPPPGTPAS